MSAPTKFNPDSDFAGSRITDEDVICTVRQLLKNKVFSGTYIERRLMEIGSVSTYKDIVVVGKSEYDFIKSLKTVNTTLIKHFRERVITCITGAHGICVTSPDSFIIWTNLTDVTLGGHWFQVRNVSLNGHIIDISLKSLRPLNAESGTSADTKFSKDIFDINLDTIKNGLIRSSEFINLENITTMARFFVVLFITFLIGCYHLLELLLLYVKELNTFVHNFIPVLVACVDGITKIFGGLYILIAMLWNSRGGKTAIPKEPLGYSEKSFYNRMIENGPANQAFSNQKFKRF